MCLQHSNGELLNSNFTRYIHKSAQDMSFSMFKQIIDLFDRSTIVSIAGVGEPMLNKDFFKMVKYAHLKKKIVTAITNGTILADKLDDLIDSPLDQISISMNAFNPNDYSDISGRDSDTFYNVVRNVSNLVKMRDNKNKKLNIKISFICTKDNFCQIHEMIKFASNLGIDEIDFLNLIPTGINRFSKEKCLYDDDLEVADMLNGLEPYYENVKVNKPLLIKRIVKKRSCRWYFENLSIDAEGYVGSCGAIIAPSSSYGNALNDIDVWNNHHFTSMRKMFLDESIPLLECCKYCVNIS
jgi:MoaA/NifB/PqqE/SkfB family radical SAM enzyme